MVRATKETKETTTTKKGKGAKAATPKGKGAKGKDAKPPRESKKSNIPAIKRPRSITQESYNEYMTSTAANFDYRIKELETMYNDSKCPHKAIQHIRSVEKEWLYFAKRILPLIKPRRKQTDKKNNILMKQVEVSPDLAKFLKLEKGEKISRSECNTAITMYVNIKNLKEVAPEKKKWIERMNPGAKRCLQSEDDGSVIVPDKPLAKLLDYEGYKKRVAAGEHYWHRKNKETGEFEDIQETDDKLTYSVVQHLLAPHFPRNEKVATPAVRGKAAPKAAPAKKAPARGKAAPKVEEPEAESEDASEAAAATEDASEE